jgi:hypothetical protein
MAGKGLREPSLFVTHLIQVAQQNQKPLQRVSLDTEIAFDRDYLQALGAFGIPQGVVQSLMNLTLSGYPRVEVNSCQGKVTHCQAYPSSLALSPLI